MEERIAMLREFDSGAFAVSDLCERFGVSRETFYVWKGRREAGGERWYEDRSRAPGHCPHATPADEVPPIVAMRERFPQFGPKKVRAVLMAERPDIAWPAASTILKMIRLRIGHHFQRGSSMTRRSDKNSFK